MNNPLKTDLFDEAAKFAIEAHHGTERRGKAYPYIIHPMEAVSIVATITNDPEMLAAAILHDVVEDTEITINQIREKFGDRVAMLVQHETAPLDETLSWKAKKTIQIEQLAHAPYDAKLVALGDKLSNIRGIALDYHRYGEDTWSLFQAPNGKVDVEWYYRSIADALSELSELEAYQHFVAMVDMVFG